MKRPIIHRAKYMFWDGISSMLAYTILYIYRRVRVEGYELSWSPELIEGAYFMGLFFITIFWITLFLVTGFYRDIYRRSRLKELVFTFNTTVMGSIFIFFALMLDDSISSISDYYRGFLVYFSAQFLISSLAHFLLSTRTHYRIKKGTIKFNTLLIGSNEKAVELYNEIGNRPKAGNHIVGFASVHNNIRFLVEKNLAHLGIHTQLASIITRNNIEEVIIAIESSEHEKLETIINILEDVNVKVKMIPDTYDIISGKVKLHSISSAPLIELNHELVPLWQRVVKRVFDILTSVFMLLLFSPILIFSAIMVKSTSKGPIFYRQKRMGLNGKEFSMIKFRSMYQDAEKHGPKLSSSTDSRITSWGRIMRKYRLDELPQFLNVIFGDMSIVGPRPERLHYVNLIKEKAPHYKHLQKVKPGITSWGMVKFGYAENVDEMVQRLKYDIIYIENMNLFNDFKILIYTVLIVLQGRGK